MNERTEQNATQTGQVPRIDSVFAETHIEPDYNPEHEPKQQYRKEWQQCNAGRKFEVIIVHGQLICSSSLPVAAVKYTSKTNLMLNCQVLTEQPGLSRHPFYFGLSLRRQNKKIEAKAGSYCPKLYQNFKMQLPNFALWTHL